MEHDSETDQYGVMGHPVAHSRSPFIHGVFARQTDQNISYRLLDVMPEEFAAEVRKFATHGGKGLNITVPHKVAAFEITDTHTRRAESARAANTLVLGEDGEILADNTDGAGLVTDLVENLNFKLEDRRILILGAGGAVRGLLGPVIAQNPKLVVIANRTPNKALELVDELGLSGFVEATGLDELSGSTFHLIVNGTSASLFGKRPPISADLFTEHTLCYDLNYGRQETPFTRWAELNGARATMGWGMLVEQAAESFYLWRGVKPNTIPVLQSLLKRP
ncbi:MAG: shikimate dehydrogenase [Gammaproteobacteria bacterium]|nr:shikimate dehydrogenase [Gammaproteobacteria bacterium]